MNYAQAVQFIQNWFSVRTLAEFCALANMDRREASNRAAQFRRLGIALPPKTNTGHARKRHLKKADIIALKSLALSLVETQQLEAEREKNKKAADKYRLNGSIESLKSYTQTLISK